MLYTEIEWTAKGDILNIDLAIARNFWKMKTVSIKLKKTLSRLSFRVGSSLDEQSQTDSVRSSVSVGSTQSTSATHSKAGKQHSLNEDRAVSYENLAEFVDESSVEPVREFLEDQDVFGNPEKAFPVLDQLQYHAVFDGHGGSRCSEFLATHLHAYIAELGSKSKSYSDLKSVLADAFKEADEGFKEQYSKDTSGSCAIVALTKKNQVTLAWVGDCRAVLFADGQVTQVSQDHRCTDPREYARIKANGGYMVDGRLAGSLIPSRSFGDQDVLARLGDGVLITEPDVFSFQVDEQKLQNTFLILATDGIWDTVSNAEACDIVRRSLAKSRGRADLAVQALVKTCSRISKGADDASAVVIVWNSSNGMPRMPTSPRSLFRAGGFQDVTSSNCASNPAYSPDLHNEEPDKQ